MHVVSAELAEGRRVQEGKVMLESGIEASFGRRIEEWFRDMPGYDCAYLKIQAAKGWPDRLLVWGRYDAPANYIWIEWKRPGEKPRPAQLHIHKILRAMGADVRVYDDYRVALEEITEAIRASAGADSGDEAHCTGRG